MPAQTSDIEEFVRISERAEECRVKRLEDVVKLKLRTPSRLYTIKLNAEEAAEVLKRLKCEVVET
jgi:phenylalanyl-tRNA synthetase beta subunit